MRFHSGVIYLLLVLASVACTRQAAKAPPTNPAASTGAFKVAMLLPRTVEADGWTRSGYKGLLLMQSELGASIAYTESVPEADFEKLFRAYAAKGCDFVIGHGGQFVPAAIDS